MQLQDLNIVVKVAEFGSISAAANALDMRAATASAALKRVEAELGAELFIRTTRQLRLSAAGERYLPQCQQALTLLAQAQQNIKAEQEVVDGELRIALSSDLGRNLLTPWLDQLLDDYPALSLRTHISDSNMDFYRDAVDVALRYGSPQDSNLYGFKICNVPGILCASPEYLASVNTPEHPQQLSQCNGLFYQLQQRVHDVWEFSHRQQPQEIYKVKMTANRIANDGDLVHRWCLAGKGVAVKSALEMADDLLSGRVVQLLPEYQARMTELWLVCPSRQSITPAVRILRDSLRQNCQALLTQLVKQNILDASVLDI